MEKEKIISSICDSGLVAVVRATSGEQAIRISEACIEGGIVAVELTFTVPFAHEIIETLAKRYSGGEVIVGAGSSLTKGAKTGDYASITETAKIFLENIKAARAAK